MIAYLLQKKGIDVLILEANTRIGGRIETVTGTTDNNGNGCHLV
jgi:monoamine oxidase